MRLLGQYNKPVFFFAKRFRAYKSADQTKTNQQNKIKRTKNLKNLKSF